MGSVDATVSREAPSRYRPPTILLVSSPPFVPRTTPSLDTDTVQTSPDSIVQQWICESCGYIYDPSEGDPDGGIPPGTAFEDIPATWVCPVCGARKDAFEPLDPR
ncbi:rubredoxin [Svornostia abyssi]|jgi:rubredoxin|uniref:rubredoxin n=1 Tax=Svornostia abyssi TaxID=2898438 RepID=UPI00338DAF62